MKLINKKILMVTAIVFASANVRADVLWQDWSVTVLRGNDYRVNYHDQSITTLEHTAGTTWGDSFFFLDHSNSANGERSNYAEWSPRASLGKLGGLTLENGLVTDVLLASTVEMSAVQTNYLYGLGFDLTVPGFKFTQLNLYRRQNDKQADNWQATVVWGLPFSLFNQQWLYDGFLDWASASRDQAANMNLTSQLKIAINPWFGVKDPLYLGVEYVYWQNKYGIADSANFHTNESNLNLLLKWHF
jgi:nucleoside-specific outer membrane channel protein Tsx